MEVFLGIGILLAAGAVFAVFIPMAFRRVVPTNEVHVVQTGKKTIAYGRDTLDENQKPTGNVYYKWPTWIPVLGVQVKVLAVSIFKIELDEYAAYDKGRLPFVVDIVSFFRINDYSMAAQKVASTDDLVEQLTTIVQGAVRSILAKAEIETIMEERSIFGQQFTDSVSEQLKSWGIEAVKNIELMDVKDAKGSDIIHNIMAKKKSHIEMESRLEVAKNKKIAESAEIESNREISLSKQEASQQVGLRTVEAELKVEQAKEAKKQMITEQSKTTTEKELEVQKLKTIKAAEIAKEAAIVASNQEKEVEIINANRIKDVALLKANQTKETELLRAEQELTVKTKQADADFQVQQKRAEAEAFAIAKKAEADAVATEKRADADLKVQMNNAKGREANGKAEAESQAALLMAPVSAQIAQAKEIGGNKEYQQYLITVEQVKANEAVGVAQAEALKAANIKMLINSGDATSGIKKVSDILTSGGMAQVGTALEGFFSTDAGKQIANKLGIDVDKAQ